MRHPAYFSFPPPFFLPAKLEAAPCSFRATYASLAHNDAGSLRILQAVTSQAGLQPIVPRETCLTNLSVRYSCQECPLVL